MAGTPIFSPDPSLYPDPTGRADRICRFVRRLKLWEGDLAGESFHLHAFQEAILRRIFGPSTEDGARMRISSRLYNSTVELLASIDAVTLVLGKPARLFARSGEHQLERLRCQRRSPRSDIGWSMPVDIAVGFSTGRLKPRRNQLSVCALPHTT